MITVKFWKDKTQAPVLVEIPEGHDPFEILERAMRRVDEIAGQAPATARRGEAVTAVGERHGGEGPPQGLPGLPERKKVRDTSLAVYRKLQQTGELGRQERQIINHFLRHPEKCFTRNEVSRDTGIRINSCTARINKLITEPWDLLEEVRKRKCSVTGETCYELRVKC